MGLLDTLKDIFKPNVGSDAEPSSWASASTYTIPSANKAASTSGKFGNVDPTTIDRNPTPNGYEAPASSKTPGANQGGVSLFKTTSESNNTQDTSGKFGNATVTKKTSGEKPTTTSSQAESRERFSYERPTEKLSERAHRKGLAAGEDYENITFAQKHYIDTYYSILDRNEVTRPYLELERMVTDPNRDPDAFKSKYQELMDYIDEELKETRKKNGSNSVAYRALERVKGDVTALGQQFAINQNLDMAEGASKQLDESINAIFAGVMNSKDYDASVEAGKRAVEGSYSAKTWFDNNMANASETQRDLMYYTFQKEGLSGVKELFNDYMGDTLNTLSASRDFADDIANNPDKASRFWEAAKAGHDSAWSSWWGGTKQMFTDTESDPNDRELVAGYTANDAIDYSLRSELGAVVDSAEFQQQGNDGFLQMRADGVKDSWYTDAQKNGTELQRQVLGNVYLATGGDTAAVAELWKGIKESGDEVWNVVNGSNTLPYDSSVVEGQMYREYLGLSGKKAPSWMSSDGSQTTAQWLWDGVVTTVGQMPQVIGQILGSLTSLIPGVGAAGKYIGAVTGAAAMTTGAYGNAYKEARDEGYDKNRAAGYAATEAASEFLADMLFSGVGPVGGILENAATAKLLANISNPIARTFANLGINMVSEGSQEYIQEIFEPIVRNLWFDEGNDFSVYTEDARYNFFMGAFSAALLGNPFGELKLNLTHEKIGKALNAQKSTAKLVDKVLNTDADSVDESKRDSLKEAKDLAEKMNSGSYKENDVNAGDLLDKAVNGGVDVSFLDNPATVSYTKEQLTVDDMRAGAVSRLAALGGDTSLAEDVAKMAKGQNVSEETQNKVNNDAKATQVLQELQGEMNLEEDNALTIAARSSQVNGAMAKISEAVHRFNPDKVIFTPAEQYLSEQGVGVADSQRIGAVINKVMDGEQITKDEAKLVRVNNPAIQGAVLATLGLDIHESTGAQGVMDALNEKAAEIASVKEMQSGVRQATAQTKAANKSGARQDSVATQNAKKRRRGKKNGTKGTSVQAQAGTEAAAGAVEGQTLPVGGGNGGVSAVAGAAQTGGPGQVRGVGERSQNGRDTAVRGPGLGPGGNGDTGDVIPVDQLTEKQRNTQRRLAADGFGSIRFMNGGISHTNWNEDLGCYEVYIRADGPFEIDQYSDHETGHLWVKALSDQDRRGFLFKVMQAFGEDFREAFTQIRQKYVGLGKFSRDVDEETVIEEMYCFARGAQNCSQKGLKDSILKFDFSKYHDAMLKIEQYAALEDMAKGNLNNPQVRQNYENGNYNHEYYERQGYLDEDFAPAPRTKAEEKKPTIPKKDTTEKRTEAKQTLDKLAEKTTEAKTEKPKKSKSKKATIPAKSEVEKLKELYDQRKAAQQRKFDEGKLVKTEEQLQNKLKKLDNEYQQKLMALYRKEAGSLAVTPEAIARAEKLSDDVRNDLISELAGLQAELKADPSIADNTGFLTRVKDWFDKASAAIDEANAEPTQRTANEELRALAQQLVANPELENDPEFRQKAEEATARAIAEMAERAANAQVSMEELAAENQQETEAEATPVFDYDAELKKLDDWRNARRKSQYEKMAKNPEKTDESLNAQLKKIEDQYQYKKQALAAQARRNGDTRFAVDPGMNVEDNNGRNDQGRAAGVREAVGAYGRGVESAGRGGPDSRGAGGVQGSEKKSSADSEGLRGRDSVKKKTLSRAQFEQKKRQLRANGAKILSDAEVHPDISAAGSFIKQMIPGTNVCFYSDPNDRRDAFFAFRKDTGVDSGIFINAARFDGGVTKDGIPAHKIAVHEMGHYYLAYAAMASGVNDKSRLAVECYKFINEQLSRNFENADDILDELDYVYESYRDRYPNSTSDSAVVEELVNDLFAGNDADFFDEDAFNAVWPLVREWFRANTDYGLLNSNEQSSFSVDPDYATEDFDTEELMDRRDEMRSGYNEAQIWQDASLNEERAAPQLSTEDIYNAKIDELMAELDAHPERTEEILAQMAVLAKEQNESNTRALGDEPTRKEKPKREEPKKPVIPPKAEAKPEPKPEPKPAATPTFDVSLSEVSGPVNVAGLTLGKAKDAVYQERKNLQKKASLTPEEQTRVQQLTEQYDRIQALIAERGKSLSDPKAGYSQRIEGTNPLAKAAKAFKPKAEKEKAAKTKTTPKSEAPAKVEKPEMKRGDDPVDVKGLGKKKAIEKVTKEKAAYEAWYAQEKGELDKQYDSGALDDKKYAKQVTRLTERRNKDVGRYNDQLKRLEAMEEKVKDKATVIKDEEITYSPKAGKWWNRIRDALTFAIRRLRSDRNTYDVRFTDSKGNQVAYNEVSPSMLETAVGEKLGSKLKAKEKLAAAFKEAEANLGEWQEVDNSAPDKAKEKRVKAPKPDKKLDNYGRKISYKMEARMANSTVRDSAGRLLNVYRLGPANGVRNANPNAMFTLWTERPASMNLMRGLNGAAAYDQGGKGVGADIENWLQELTDHPNMSEANKNAIRAKIAAAERKMREYTTHITRLDPFRPGYTNPNREDVIGNHTLLEGYIDIRNPLVIDAQGKGMAYVRDTLHDFVSNPANLAGQVDVDGNPLGEYDGIKFINVTVTDGNKTLGGGQLDRDTVYATFRANQGKSTYNTNPTDSELMQYAVDPDTETGYAEGTLEDTILRVLQDKDYNHAVEALTMYLAQYLQTGVLPEIENEKTREIFQARITPAEHNYYEQRAKELIDSYGRIEPGEKPVRSVFMPKERADGNVRQSYRTAAESRNTPEWGVDFLMREVLTSDDAVYEKITDKKAIDAAKADMKNKGYEQMLAEWRAKADGETAYRIDKYDVAKAVALYSEAFAAGNAEDALAIIAELAEVETTSAQIVQAARLIKKMPPSYQLYYLRRVVNRLNQRYKKRIDSGRMPEITLDRDLARAVLRAKSQEELDTAMKALIEDVAKNIPVTLYDQWNAWRYLSMLGNPKTHIRNYFGNMLFVPAKFSKDLIAAGLEGMFIKDRSQRRTSLKGVVGRNTEYRELAKADYETVKQELQSGGKYNIANEIMNARTIFKWSKTLEFLRKFNGEKLESEDGAFLKFHYVNALTNFLATQGMSAKDLRDKPEGRKIMNAARLYAFNEAQKATYRDASTLAAALNQMKQKSGPVGVLFEGVFPFTKTPINILKRGVEYSPIGLLDSLSRGLYQLKSGDITANEFIDRIASGLTGTGVMMFGAWLASMGILRGGDDDDDKQADFDQLQGYQNYSINIGSYNFTIDWAAPMALPLFVGCEIVKQLREDGEFSYADFLDALLVISEPITQLSMLSGINDLLTSTKYDEHPLSSAIETMASGYLTQALPTLVAQLSRSFSADRRTTFVDKNSDVPQPIQRWWQTNVLGKTPLNAARTEYIDAWGRKDTTSSFVARLFENMISPGYINRIKTTPVDEELQKLADKVGTGVLMTVPERSISFGNVDHHLTAGQYQTYAKTRGDAAMEMLSDLFNSEGYQNEMSDDEKAYAVNLIKQYANILGKQAVFGEYDTTDDNWAEKCDGDPTRITNTAMLKAIAHEAGVTFGNNSKAYGLITEQSWLTPVDQGYAVAQLLDLGSDKYVYEASGGPKYAIGAEQKQIIAEHFRQIFPAYYVELADTEKWANADSASRVEMLSDVRKDAKADAKAWMAHILAAQGAPLYVG